MSDGDVYKAAKLRITALQQELHKLQTFVDTFEELAAQMHPPVADDLGASDTTDTRPVLSAPDVDRPRAVPQSILEDAVTDILERNGAPMQRGELFNRVKARGFVIGGRDELLNLGSKLSRSQRLVNLKRHGYWPKDQPFEPAGYRPGQLEQTVES